MSSHPRCLAPAVLAPVLLAAATGAAAQTGPAKPLTITTTPPGAGVEMTDGTRCTTPCSLDMAGKHGSVATISLLGYKPVQTPIRVDASGAADPNPIEVTFAKEDPGAAVTPSGAR